MSGAFKILGGLSLLPIGIQAQSVHIAGVFPTIGENWFYAALGWNLNSQNKLEAGLLYVTWDIGNKSWFNQYYLQFTWINYIDLRKKPQQP